MMHTGLDLNDVRMLMKVIEHGSYTAASRATGVPKSTISQRIAALERAIGTGLIRRTSRSFSLTEAGELLLPHAQAIDRLAHAAERALQDRGDVLGGTLRVTASVAVAQFALGPILPRFLAKYPGVTVRLEPTNRYVDIVGEGYDLALRAHALPLKDSSLLQRIVARTPWCLMASPEWLARNGTPTSPDHLSAASCLYFATSPEGASYTFTRGEEIATIILTPRLWSEDMAALRAACLEGGGVTALPHYLVAAEAATGRLVEVLPEWRLPVTNISTLTPPRLQSSRLTKAFSDFLARELRKVAEE